MIEGDGPDESLQTGIQDVTRPRGPVAHKEIDIGEEPNATTDSSDSTTTTGGAGNS